jgi:hypothetical protein
VNTYAILCAIVIRYLIHERLQGRARRVTAGVARGSGDAEPADGCGQESEAEGVTPIAGAAEAADGRGRCDRGHGPDTSSPLVRGRTLDAGRWRPS